MRIVFCGTPQFAVSSLAALLDAGHDICQVLTQPDKPVGRKLEMQASAVKQFALSRGLPTLTPVALKLNEDVRHQLEVLDAEVFVVVAYGRLLPAWMLSMPKLGCINVHGSLLPKYRGAAPIQWALANGEPQTGVTTMLLNEGMDTGDKLLMQAVPIPDSYAAPQLFHTLAHVGAELLLKTLEGLAAGTLQPQPQEHRQASYAPLLTREDGRFSPERSAAETWHRWRGFMPWPGCWCEFRGRRLLLSEVSVVAGTSDATPGTLLLPDASLLDGSTPAGSDLCLVCAGGSLLKLVEVKPEGKAGMSGAHFAAAFQVQAGERVG